MKSIMGKPAAPAFEGINIGSMNRIPPADGYQMQQGEIVPGKLNTWYEFVPPCYDGSCAVPLVLHLHGGGNDGKRWLDMHIWHEIAKRENLIVVFPNSPNYGSWMCEDEDVNYLKDLIGLLTGKYNIDKSRIYMQGMSNGDMMTLAFSMRHPELLAAAGYATGPSAEEAIAGDSPRGALPIIQMRGELDVYWHLPDDVVDVYATRYGMNDRNRELWETANGTAGKLPEVAIRGMDNFLIYHGDRAPLISWEIKNCGHRDPVNVAEVFWKRLYSGARLVDSEHVYDAPDMPVTGDENTVILATGSRYAYKKDRMILMSEQPKATARTFTPIVPRPGTFKLGEMAETEYMAAPADFFASVYGAKVEYNAMGDGVTLTLADGRVVELMNQSILVKVDGEFRTVQKPCVLLSGVLFVPVGELCQMLFDAHVTVAEDVMCISDHHAVLGRYTASILRKLMGGVMRPRTRPEEW